MSLKRASEKRSISRSSLKKSSSREDDPHTVAAAITKEVLTRALEKIHERYMENQTINFVVHCAHLALIKVLRVHFYQHNPYVRTPAYWGSDRRAEPSPPDSWALHQVPSSRNITTEQEVNTLDDLVVGDGGFDATAVPSDSLLDDIRATVYGIVDNLPTVDEETSEKSESVVSAFTMVVEGGQDFADFKMKPQLSRVSMGESTMFKLPRIDLPESGNSRRYQSVTELVVDEERLPPIRTDANYKCRSFPVQEEKPKKPKN